MRRYTFRRLIWAGPLATAAATLADLIYFLVSRASGEEYLLPLDTNGSQLTPMPLLVPVLGALIVGAMASLFFGVLLRYAREPVTVFLSVAITALILSFGGPFGIPAAALATKLLLSGMNLLTALILTGGILLFSRDKGPHPQRK